MSVSRRLSVTHETAYSYGTAVELAHHLAHLRPLDDALQVLSQYRLTVEPEPGHSAVDVDAFGNTRQFFSFYQPHHVLRVRAESIVEVRASAAERPAGPPWEAVRDSLRFAALRPWNAASEFLFASPYVPLHRELTAYGRESFPAGRPVLAAALDLMHRIHADFKYATASTDVSTPVHEVFRQKVGVCQDFAHVMISCLRGLGLSARYVSGYILTSPAPGAPPRLGADASHAWVSIWCPHVARRDGWVDLDPTNDLLVADEHVTLAVGRDYGDVTPLRGVIRGGTDHTLTVAVTVAAVEEGVQGAVQESAPRGPDPRAEP